jgi:hypothetical protein
MEDVGAAVLLHLLELGEVRQDVQVAVDRHQGIVEIIAPGERRPTGMEPGAETKPALWAVRSTG